MKSIKIAFAVVVGFFAIFPSLGFAQSPPTIQCGSYRVAQGDSCNNGYAPAYDAVGRPLGLRVGDIRGNSGQYVQQYGQMAQVGALGLNNCELGGAAIGAGVGYLVTGKKNHTGGAIGGAILGAIAGDKYCESQALEAQQLALQQRQQYRPQQRPQQTVGNPCDPQKGHPAGSRPGRLNLPGDAKDGQPVCAMPGDPNISEWL